MRQIPAPEEAASLISPRGRGFGLGLLLLRLPDFTFLTAISFGHNDLLLIVEAQLRRFGQTLQQQRRLFFSHDGIKVVVFGRVGFPVASSMFQNGTY
jgi:hypothetical protein